MLHKSLLSSVVDQPFWSLCEQVHEVSPVDEGGSVTITATLKEKADLYGANGKHADSYNNPYTVEYTVVESEGQWKIIDALVLGTHAS